MKQRKQIFVLLLMTFCILAFVNSETYAAKTDAKVLKENKTYSLDLNGDSTKEKVKITTKINEEKATGIVSIYIDGKRVFKKDYGPYYCDPYVYCMDINTKDQYRELLVTICGPDIYTNDLFVLRYKGDGKVKKFLYDGTIEKGFMVWGGYFEFGGVVENTGKNKFYMSEWTPIKNKTFGCFITKTEFKLKNGKLVKVIADAYDVLPDSFPSEKYQLAKERPLYSSASTKSKKVTIKKGTKFIATQVKRGKGNDKKGYNLFVKIKTTKGKTGWLYFPNEGKKILKTIPSAL